MIDKNLLKEALKFKYYLAAIILLGILIVLFAVSQAKALSHIIDAVFIKDFQLNRLWVWMSILLFFIVFRAALLWANEVLSKTLATKIKHDLRMRIQNTIIAAGPVKLRDERAGEVVNLAVEGVEALDAYFSEYLPQLAISVLAPILILIFAFPADLISSVIMLITAPLIPLFMILIGKWAHRMTEHQWKTLSKLGGHFLDIVRGLPTLKLFGRSKTQSNVIYRISEDFRSSTMAVLRISFLSALVLELLATLSTAVIAVSLGLRLIYGHMAFADALFLLLIIPEYYQPLRQLGAKFHAGMGGSTAAKDIYGFFKEYPASNEKQSMISIDKTLEGTDFDISFCGVSFRYGNSEEPAINNISFSIRRGECTILAGESGSGKSTLASLLLGFIQPHFGSIYVNGHDLMDFPSVSWRAKIAYVPQHPYLFSGTIEENIMMANPSATKDEIYAAAKLSGIHDFILALPMSYETHIGEGGQGLSGGQKQLISLARAFLKNAPIVVMDEPTSNLDYEAEEKVIQAIEKLIAGRTVLLITHSPYLLKKADNVLVMKNGGLSICAC